MEQGAVFHVLQLEQLEQLEQGFSCFFSQVAFFCRLVPRSLLVLPFDFVALDRQDAAFD